MLQRIRAAIPNALEVATEKVKNTAVVISSKNPPKWAVKGAALDDLEKTKAVWSYTRGEYQRALVVKVKDAGEVFESACKVVGELKARKIAEADVMFPKNYKEKEVTQWMNTAILRNYEYSAKTMKPSAKNSEEPAVENSGNAETTEEKAEPPTFFINKLSTDFKFSNQSAFEQSLASAYCALYARNLSNTRGSVATPSFLAEKAQEIYLSNPNQVQLEVLKGDELLSKNLNLLYNVGKAASSPPHLVLLRFNNNPESEHIALVGKGVTFDTGGLNLKPTNSIEDMYLDKSGACTSLAVFKWAVETNAPVNLTCVLALAENAIGSRSYKPLDIITSLKGLTVEIGNTDAEGRLCLADALTYAQIHYKPKLIIDLATLTGACVVALGEQTAGAFGNDSKLIESLKAAGEYYQEEIWHMPISKHHEKSIKGKVADLSNTGKARSGGASTAAAFLKNFVEKDVKWAHLDIAGPAMNSAARGQFSAGGTGFGVQLLTRFLMDRGLTK